MSSTVRVRRKAAGFSVGQLARRADIADATLRNIELDQGNPTIGTLEKIAGVLGCEVRDLISETKK